MLKQAIVALRSGDRTAARQLLGNVLALDSDNELAWLWLSGAVETREERIACLENVLSINPDSEAAKHGLAQLGAPLRPARPPAATQAAAQTQPAPVPSAQDFGGAGSRQAASANHLTGTKGQPRPAASGKSGSQASVDTLLKVVAALTATAVAAIFVYLALMWTGDSLPNPASEDSEVAAGAAQAEWQQIGSQDGRFAVMMPEFPDYDVQEVLTPVGTLELHIFSVSGEDSIFMAAYNDYPEFIINGSDAGKMLDGARDGAVANVGGKLLSETQIRLQGHPGRELWIEADVDGQEGLARARIFLVDRRLYQILVAGPKDQFPNHDAERCLNSFLLVQ